MASDSPKREKMTPASQAVLIGMAKFEAVRLRETITSSTQRVPVYALVEQAGARIEYTTMESDGSVRKVGEQYVVQVDRDAIPSRQRFTLAHELGHIVFDRLTRCESLIRYRWRKVRPTLQAEEFFCDVFASYLLIPDEAIADLCAWRKITVDSLCDRAKQLEVSFTALARRVLQSMPNPGGALWLRQHGRPTNQRDIKWRVYWGYFPNQEYPFPIRYKSIPDDSLIHPVRVPLGNSTYRNVSLEFCGIKGRRSMLVKRTNQALLAIAFPPNIDIDQVRFKGQSALDC